MTPNMKAKGMSHPVWRLLVGAAIVLACSVADTGSALAYVGPGAGITMLGALWAVIAGIVLAVLGLMIWPIRAYLRRRKRAAGGADEDELVTETSEKAANDPAE